MRIKLTIFFAILLGVFGAGTLFAETVTAFGRPKDKSTENSSPQVKITRVPDSRFAGTNDDAGTNSRMKVGNAGENPFLRENENSVPASDEDYWARLADSLEEQKYQQLLQELEDAETRGESVNIKTVKVFKSSPKSSSAESVPEENQNFLEGCIYDLKRSRNGAILCTTASSDSGKRKAQLHKALAILHNDGKMGGGSWDVTKLNSQWFQAPTTIYGTEIFFVGDNGQALQATRVTKVFADPRTGKEPFEAPGWLCVFKGKFSVPASGYYRFVGMGDDAMLVGVGKSASMMQTVLYAFWPGEGHGNAISLPKGKSQITDDPSVASNIGDQWEPKNFCGKGGYDGRNSGFGGQRNSLYKGHWLKLHKGINYHICVAFGEAVGGLAGATLGIQKRGRDDDWNFPMFSLVDLTKNRVPAGWRITHFGGRYNMSEFYGTK